MSQSTTRPDALHARHVPANANQRHKEKMNPLDKLGFVITRAVGKMIAALLFTVLALISLPAALKTHDKIVIVAWIAQTFLQLVLLPIIMVGQNIQGKHAQLRAEHDFETDKKAEKEIETVQILLEKERSAHIQTKNELEKLKGRSDSN